MNKRHSLICVGAIAILLACHSHSPSATKAITDSTTITAIIPAPAQQKTTAGPPTASADSGEGARELQGFHNEYIASYTTRCVIDSSFQQGTDHFTIHVQDSCLMDSAIVIPKIYGTTINWIASLPTISSARSD
jgi:hypothetical protein